MDQSRVIGLIDGFFPFGKKSKVQESRTESHALAEVSQIRGGGSGELISDLTTTGVTRYLSRMPVESTVSRYVRIQHGKPVSGVSRYVTNQALAVRESAGETGVAKYLKKTEQSEPAASGVAKYMARQLVQTMNRPAITTVAKYLGNLELTENENQGLTGVAKYQAEKAKLAKKAEAQKLVEKYIQEEAKMAKARAAKEAKRAAIEQQKKESDVLEITAGTGVGRYLQLQGHIQSKRPPVTGVAKYVARQIVSDACKPPMSGVAKYLSRQHKYSEADSLKSSVAKYLEIQEQRFKELPVMTGVEKYLTTRTLLTDNKIPEQSGVAKYLFKREHFEKVVKKPEEDASSSVTGKADVETRVSKYINEFLADASAEEAVTTIVEKCLEGEFIPAGEADQEVAAIKDVEPPVAAKEPAKKAKKATGVSKYMEEQIAEEKKAKAKKRTGVEKYLSELVPS